MERKFEVNSGEGRTKGEGNSDVEEVVALGLAAEVLAGLGAFLPLERAMIHSAARMQVIVHLEPGIRSSTASTVSRRVRNLPGIVVQVFPACAERKLQEGQVCRRVTCSAASSFASRWPLSFPRPHVGHKPAVFD